MDEEIHTVLWRRLDLPGHEACRLTALGTGWQIAGTAVFAHEGQACRLDYAIACDEQWRTLSALVSGWVGEQDVEAEVIRDEAGLWRLNGDLIPEVEGCVDVDLNFSPSTNTLPIRRFGLEVGQSVQVRAAWLRFPSFRLEPLQQSYTRIGANLYRYESAGGRFVASVEVDAAGLVTEYGEIWGRS
ncbi:MAG TPA: putative glycolipid-binding domain-containing protein [Thermoanaerobaculia bacterium]